MKDVAKKLSSLVPNEAAVVFRVVARGLGFGILGFVAARTGVLGQWYPFGVSFIAASPVTRLVFCFLGVLLGYLFPTAGGNMFMYIASAAAAAAIRLITVKYLNRSGARLWVFFSSSLLIFLTGSVTNGAGLLTLVSTLIESIIAGVAGYFADLSFGSSRTRASAPYAIVFTACLLLTGLMRFSVSGVSAGVAIAAAAVCLAGCHGGAASGALCGALCGLCLIFSGGDLLGGMVLVLSGVAAGLCSGYGKTASSCAALLTAICLVAALGFRVGSVGVLSSMLIGTSFFFFIPSSASSRLAFFFRRASLGDPAYGMRRTVELKLGFAADALRRINSITSEVSDKLSKTDGPLFDRVLSGVKRDCCMGCSFCECCWKLEKAETERTMREMARSFHNRRPASLAGLSDSFSARCPRKERVENSIMKFYSRFLDETANDRCAREARNALYDQFGAISEMLDETARDIARADNYDAASAQAVASVLSGLGFDVRQCYCLTDELGRMRVEAVLAGGVEAPLGRSRIKDAVSEVCGREFGNPEIKRAEKEYLLSVCEKTRFELDYSSFSIKCDKAPVCGDDSAFFTDGKGKAYMIISDGMGTGSRAAIDSRMASGLAVKLLESGFGYSCTLKMINTAMMYRSGEESLATLDITAVDLYSGEAELRKAGSAPTFIRRGGYVVRADCKSLPLGIVRNVSFDRAASRLSAGDIILMVSDGVTADDTDWINTELESFDGSAEGLCRHIATEARKRRCDGHSDDITVSAAILRRND